MGTWRLQLRADGSHDPSTRQTPPRASRSFPTLCGFTPSPHLPTTCPQRDYLCSSSGALPSSSPRPTWKPSWPLPCLLPTVRCALSGSAGGVKMTTGIFRVVLVSRPLHPASSAWPHSQACRTPVGVLGSRLPRSRENSSESLRGAAQRRSRTPIQSSGSERCQQRPTRCDPCQRSLHPHLKNWVYAFTHMTEQAYTGDKQPLFQQFCQT